MKTDIEQIAEQLSGWDRTAKQPESCDGQKDLFATERGLPKKAKREFANGQDFLFELRKE